MARRQANGGGSGYVAKRHRYLAKRHRYIASHLKLGVPLYGKEARLSCKGGGAVSGLSVGPKAPLLADCVAGLAPPLRLF